MEFLIAGNTDVGITKKTNQDSYWVKMLETPCGKMAFGIVCDGMGGLEKGELASATLLYAFNEWVEKKLIDVCKSGFSDSVIREQWCAITIEVSNKLMDYGKKNNIKLGTTLAAILVTQERYYIVNVGDSRIYEITAENGAVQLTKDQTFVAREIESGRMTPEQAAVDSRRNVLLQCVGASEQVYPEMFYGVPKKDALYMLCSDGFRHEITSGEINSELTPDKLCNYDSMLKRSKKLIELNKSRGETDNITIAMIRTY